MNESGKIVGLLVSADQILLSLPSLLRTVTVSIQLNVNGSNVDIMIKLLKFIIYK